MVVALNSGAASPMRGILTGCVSSVVCSINNRFVFDNKLRFSGGNTNEKFHILAMRYDMNFHDAHDHFHVHDVVHDVGSSHLNPLLLHVKRPL